MLVEYFNDTCNADTMYGITFHLRKPGVIRHLGMAGSVVLPEFTCGLLRGEVTDATYDEGNSFQFAILLCHRVTAAVEASIEKYVNENVWIDIPPGKYTLFIYPYDQATHVKLVLSIE